MRKVSGFFAWAGLLAVLFTVPKSVTAAVLINEVDADTPGTDTMEFVELYDGGVGMTPLNGLVLVFFNGSNEESYAVCSLDGLSTDGRGFFVAGDAGVPGVQLILSAAIQNGPDAVALYEGQASDFPNGTLITTEHLLDALVYSTKEVAGSGLLALLLPDQAVVNEAGAGDKDGHSSQRIPDGAGGPRVTSGYGQLAPTPGAPNAVPLPSPVLLLASGLLTLSGLRPR